MDQDLNSLLEAEETPLSPIAVTIHTIRTICKAITDVRSNESLLQGIVALAASMPDLEAQV